MQISQLSSSLGRVLDFHFYLSYVSALYSLSNTTRIRIGIHIRIHIRIHIYIHIHIPFPGIHSLAIYLFNLLRL